MAKYKCSVCGYVYDEEKEGKTFKSLPETFVCPLCKAPKSMFKLDGEEVKAKKEYVALDTEEVKELSFMQMSAVCSNLARGSEKQYKPEEQKLFLELAEYFEKVAPKEEKDANNLLNLVDSDLESGYPALKNSAEKEKDRGTQRICVWGEKVSLIAKSLLERYKNEGTDFIKGNKVYVCSICGFIYIGDSAPSLCPVCKVPAWKFDEIKGKGE